MMCPTCYRTPMAYRLDPNRTGIDRREKGDAESPRAMRRRRAARRTMSVLPTLCTLGNLLCGFLSIFIASRPPEMEGLPWNWSPLTLSAALIFLGMAFDGLDGWVARRTHSTSNLGEQLDSMADMVTFGAAPAFMAVQLVGVQLPFISGTDDMFSRLTLLIAGIYVACAALRLARFNVEVSLPTEKDHLSFKGLPSPGAAGTVASFVLLHQHFLRHAAQSSYPWAVPASRTAMVALMMIAAVAMVSRLRYAHIVNRYLRGRVRFRRVAMGVIFGMFAFLHPQGALATGFGVYAASAPAIWLMGRLFGRSQAQAAGAVGEAANASPDSGKPEFPPQQDQSRTG